jgi:hypothetical protein
MNCPECDKPLTSVQIKSECWQAATVNENQDLEDFRDLEVGATLMVICSNCAGIVTHLVI